jgi:hypothetical protein
LASAQALHWPPNTAGIGSTHTHTPAGNYLKLHGEMRPLAATSSRPVSEEPSAARGGGSGGAGGGGAASGETP